MMTDPIADMLTRIRNAKSVYHSKLTVPHSKIKERILGKLKQEGYITDYKVGDQVPQPDIEITLKYGSNGEQIIQKLMRVSKPGLRVYRKASKIEKVLGGLGTAIVSTSKGILTDRECREQKVGGEIICKLW